MSGLKQQARVMAAVQRDMGRRSGRLYGERSEHRAFDGYDVSTPTEGWYRYRLTRGGVYGAVRVWYGQPPDPVTGELLDRSLRWQATFNGEPIDLDRVWPQCGREPITEGEAQRLIQQAAWASNAAPDSAYADPRKKIDRLSRATPLPF